MLFRSVEGALPPELDGTFLRNGANPARAESPAWFVGDGMLHGVRIERGRARWYRNRFVQTDEFRAEEAAGRLLYRGFGTNLPGGLWPNLLHTRFSNKKPVLRVAQRGACWRGAQTSSSSVWVRIVQSEVG